MQNAIHKSQSVLVFALVLFAASAAPEPQRYQLIHMGTLRQTPPPVPATGQAMNEHGQVTGLASTDSDEHAFLWDGTSLIDLGTLANTGSSLGLAINDTAEVTGYSTATVYGEQHAFLWSRDAMIDLGTLGGLASVGRSINASGHVAGESYTADNLRWHIFYWNGLSMLDLGNLGGSNAEVTDMNDSGQVVGSSMLQDEVRQHAFLWDGQSLIDLGTLGGTNSGATDINEFGEITGYSELFANVESHAFLWNGARLVDLGTLGGTSSSGSAINNAGQITGGASRADRQYHAFLWSDGVMRDLGTLGSISNGVDVNDSGQVVGYSLVGTGNYAYRAFLWQNGLMMDLNELLHPSDPFFPYVHFSGASKITEKGEILVGGLDSRDVWPHTYVLSPMPEVLGPIRLADITRDGVDELAIVRGSPTRIEVRAGDDGSLVKSMEFFSFPVTPIDVVVLPDMDGDGAEEVAVLAIRKSDGRALAEIRNIVGAENARQIWFSANCTPISMRAIADDADGNGLPELAVLMLRNSDRRGFVEIKNAFGPTNSNVVWSSAGLIPADLEVVPDSDGNGVPEVAVLSSRVAGGRIVVEIRNAAGPTNPNSVWFMAGNKAIDLTVVNDADGNLVPEVAVLSRRASDWRLVAEVKNARGATNPSTIWFAPSHVGLAVSSIGDADGNGVPDIAVLSRRDSDSRIVVEIKNAFGTTNPRSLWYPAGYRMRNLQSLGDIDGNSVVDALVLMTRESDDRILVESRNAAGTQAPKDYWFSP